MGPVCIATAVARRCAAVRSLKPAVAASAREEGRRVRTLDSETAIQRLVTECFDSLEIGFAQSLHLGEKLEEQCTAATHTPPIKLWALGILNDFIIICNLWKFRRSGN